MGWDRMSSADDDLDDGPEGRVEDSLERTEGSEEGAGPVGEAGVQEPT